MSFLDTITDLIWRKLEEALSPILTPLTKLWNVLKGTFTAIYDVFPETKELIELIISETKAWRSFSAHPQFNFKTGVVNLKHSKDRFIQLWTELKDGWNSLVDLFTGGLKQFTIKPIQEGTEAVAEVLDAFEAFGKLGLKEFVQRFGASIEKAGGKVFEVIAIIQAVAEELLKVVRQVHAIVTAVKDIRETIETGEGLFLSQTNKRKKVALSDGGTIYLRRGKLHRTL